ncbi:uncharacterized protein BDZ99DRAFT_86543 [Mytilinidion resinicola]|uniref:Uncharacterized protein n=1 Tax=Mytilinidion resinicola TaxID=574789 RepID=A0A6A6YG42_9PEZI|nr:uncharacterized protein BDZ99DRAFT_86543 [Mytilinidion resinicola]KAF2806857.1 hypothetical protein BDZ99DRAFT_86543 [Mytilinidion resinicola]
MATSTNDPQAVRPRPGNSDGSNVMIHDKTLILMQHRGEISDTSNLISKAKSSIERRPGKDVVRDTLEKTPELDEAIIRDLKGGPSEGDMANDDCQRQDRDRAVIARIRRENDASIGGISLVAAARALGSSGKARENAREVINDVSKDKGKGNKKEGQKSSPRNQERKTEKEAKRRSVRSVRSAEEEVEQRRKRRDSHRPSDSKKKDESRRKAPAEAEKERIETEEEWRIRREERSIRREARKAAMRAEAETAKAEEERIANEIAERHARYEARRKARQLEAAKRKEEEEAAQREREEEEKVELRPRIRRIWFPGHHMQIR